MNRNLALAALRLIAAKAEKLGYDLEHNRLWEGEYERGLEELARALADAQQSDGRHG